MSHFDMYHSVMNSNLFIGMSLLSGAFLSIGTCIFWKIYLDAAKTATVLLSGLDLIAGIPEEEVRRWGREEETHVRERKFQLATFRLISSPFQSQKLAHLGFAFYILAAVVTSATAIASVAH